MAHYYNGYAVQTGKLAPKGWHVPSKLEWETLINNLGGEDVAGGKLKETGTDHWNSPNENFSSNSSGFTGMPGGYREYSSGVYVAFGYFGFYWTSTPYNLDFNRIGISADDTHIGINPGNINYGFSVRCIHD